MGMRIAIENKDQSTKTLDCSLLLDLVLENRARRFFYTTIDIRYDHTPPTVHTEHTTYFLHPSCINEKHKLHCTHHELTQSMVAKSAGPQDQLSGHSPAI